MISWFLQRYNTHLFQKDFLYLLTQIKYTANIVFRCQFSSVCNIIISEEINIFKSVFSNNFLHRRVSSAPTMRWRKRITIRGCQTSRWRWTRTKKRWRSFSWWNRTSPWYVRSTVESAFAITVFFWASFTRLIQECEQKRKRERKLNCRFSSSVSECTRLRFEKAAGKVGGEIQSRVDYFFLPERWRFVFRPHMVVHSRRFAWDARNAPQYRRRQASHVSA